ncbi:hypothetical protein ABZ953_09550 [Streptomyces sp. NPDC046465]|uniref:hypothetical protein n=1 Tax=Streptomyces sp. NPDC046465 TaxID=3155810 RepID=UPI0033E351DD
MTVHPAHPSSDQVEALEIELRERGVLYTVQQRPTLEYAAQDPEGRVWIIRAVKATNSVMAPPSRIWRAACDELRVSTPVTGPAGVAQAVASAVGRQPSAEAPASA